MRARPPRNTVDGSLRGGLVTDQHWTAYGACSGAPPDDLFVEGAAQRTAREVCANCAVRVDFLIDALDHRILFGVWGGTTERERRALLRRYPDVGSWREIIDTDPDIVAYVPAVRSGSQVWTSGQLPFVDGVLPVTGKVGHGDGCRHRRKGDAQLGQPVPDAHGHSPRERLRYATRPLPSGPGITWTSSQPSAPHWSRIALVACTMSGTVAYSQRVAMAERYRPTADWCSRACRRGTRYAPGQATMSGSVSMTSRQEPPSG